MNMPDTYPSLFWGYCFIWVVIVLYLLRLGSKLDLLEKKLRQEDSGE